MSTNSSQEKQMSEKDFVHLLIRSFAKVVSDPEINKKLDEIIDKHYQNSQERIAIKLYINMLVCYINKLIPPR